MEVIAAGLADLDAGAIEASDEIKDSPRTSSFRLRQSLAVSIKSFAYPANPHFCLTDIDLEILKGQTVGLIG